MATSSSSIPSSSLRCPFLLAFSLFLSLYHVSSRTLVVFLSFPLSLAVSFFFRTVSPRPSSLPRDSRAQYGAPCSAYNVPNHRFTRAPFTPPPPFQPDSLHPSDTCTSADRCNVDDPRKDHYRTNEHYGVLPGLPEEHGRLPLPLGRGLV